MAVWLMLINKRKLVRVGLGCAEQNFFDKDENSLLCSEVARVFIQFLPLVQWCCSSLDSLRWVGMYKIIPS